MNATLPDADVRRRVVAACRHLSAVGLSPGSSGNLSVRIGEHLLVTPTGSSFARVGPGDLAVVTLDGMAPSGSLLVGAASDGSVISGRPSKEVPLHRAVYAARPDARAVVHLHSPYAAAAACLQLPDGEPTLPPLTPYQVMRLGDLPVAPYAAPGSSALADGVASLAGRHAALLLANHGSLAAATDLDSAVDLAEEIEAAARVALLLRGLPTRSLTQEQVAALRR